MNELHFHPSLLGHARSLQFIYAATTGAMLKPSCIREAFDFSSIIIELPCTVTDELVKIDKSILKEMTDDAGGINHSLYSKSLIDYYRSFTILVFDTCKNTNDFIKIHDCEEYQFLKLLRDASAHNNVFFFYKRTKEELQRKPVNWRSKTIDTSTEGKILYMEFFEPGDLILLLHDISLKAESAS